MLSWRASCIGKRIQSLEAEIGRVSAKHHAYNVPQFVYGALLDVLDKATSDVTRAKQRFEASADSFDARQFAAILNTIEEDVTFAVKLFRNCDRVDSARVPFEILAALTSAAQTLLGENVSVILHLTSEYNYKIYSCSAWFQKAKWKNPWPASSSADVLILVFPSYEVSSVTLHAAAAHEFGHVLAANWAPELAKIILPAVNARHLETPDEKNLAVAERVIKVPGAGDVLYATAWDEIQERLVLTPIQWATEVTADLIASRLVGPAFIAALERITLAATEASDSHPSDRLRRSYLADYLRSELPEIAEDLAWESLLQPGDAISTGRTLPPRFGGEDYIYKVATLVLRDCYPKLKELVRRIPSPLLTAPAHEESISETKLPPHNSLPAMLTHIDGSFSDLVPPSCGCEIFSDGDVARHFWLFFYGAWRFRLGPLFNQFYGARSSNANGSQAENVMNSMLLHSLQSLSVSLRVHTFRRPSEAEVNTHGG